MFFRIRNHPHRSVNCPRKKNNSERPVDALAEKKVNYWLTDNLKSRDASASKNIHKMKGCGESR